MRMNKLKTEKSLAEAKEASSQMQVDKEEQTCILRL